MIFWNYIMIAMGIVQIIMTLIRRFTGYGNEKYLSKLELKYGNIDRERAIKFDFLYSCINWVGFILIGLLLRDMMIAMTLMITMITISIIGYYMLRKIYITANSND